jgi:hypothetical protein
MVIRRLELTTLLLLAGMLFTACQDKDDKSAYQEQATVGSVIPTAEPESTPTVLPESTIASPTVLPELAAAAVANATEGSDKAAHPSDTKIEGDLMEEISEDISKEFYYEELPTEVIDRIRGKSYKKDCTVPHEELRYVRVLYWGFDEKAHKGEMIVNKAIAKDTVEIFRELYDKQYPIERMVLVDEYDADDNESMAADNSSCFNYRNIDGKKKLSLHSYGLAIDINPLYNPYVRTIEGKEDVLPKSGTKYADRSRKCKYYIDTEDACYKAFTEHGFTWGGEWIHSKDYQHFQKELD